MNMDLKTPFMNITNNIFTMHYGSINKGVSIRQQERDDDI